MKKWTMIVLSLFFIISCGGSSSSSDSCSVSEQNSFVYDYMQDNYLWYKELPSLDYQNYSSPEALLEDLKNEKDKWSFIVDKETLDDYFSGEGYIGYGIKLTYNESSELYISLVYPDSPASKAGFKRGTQIVKINSVDVDEITDLNSALGEDKIGVETTFDVIVDSEYKSVTLAKEQIVAPSVLKSDVLDIAGYKVGYLLFDKFIEPSTDELKGAFEYFANENIDKLIVDLRYNGGGLVNVANDLVSLIDGLGNSSEISLSLEFNDKNSYKNSNYYIKEYDESFSLDEVYFITTNSTCSASESVINALKPYGVDVKLIGESTCGKPVGMVGGEFCDKFCDKYIMPIEFSIVNSDGEGDYFGGMAVDCSASDDIYHDFSDLEENMLKATAYYIENGECLDGANARVVSAKEPKTIELKGIKSITTAF